MPKAPIGLVVALPLLLSAAPAGADLAPGPGYVESCTLDEQQKGGEECLACSASFEDPDACKTKHQASGLQQRCKTAGASVWTEIWCRAKAEAAPSATSAPEPAPAPSAPAPAVGAPPEKSGSCGACAAGSGDGSGAALWSCAGLVLALVLRRRRAG